MVPAAFLLAMAPLSNGIVTLTSVVAKPAVISTARTQTRLSVVLTDLVVVTPATDDARPKSAATTPVTAVSNVAVYVSCGVASTVPLTPIDEEKVGVGGLYLIQRNIQSRR